MTLKKSDLALQSEINYKEAERDDILTALQNINAKRELLEKALEKTQRELDVLVTRMEWRKP